MMRSGAAYMGLRPEDITIIGDTMETDIIGGIYMGFKTILVLSGIADQDKLKQYGYRPSLIVQSVDQIEFPLKWWPR